MAPSRPSRVTAASFLARALLSAAVISAAIVSAAISPAASQTDPPAGRPGAPLPGSPPPGSHFPGGLPDGWRMLGDDEPTPGEPFDFDRDGLAVPTPPNALRRQAPPDYYPTRPGAKPAPVKDEATLKAEREKARADALKKASAPKPEPAALRRMALDALFAKLAAAPTPQEAQPVALAIQHVLDQSGSDTAALVMARARAAAEAHDGTTALALLDRLVAYAPDWAQAYAERARVRLGAGDFDGAMADVDKALRLEPRHFEAMLAMGEILRRVGLDQRALEVYEKALAIYPAQPELKAQVEALTLKVRGRDI